MHYLDGRTFNATGFGVTHVLGNKQKPVDLTPMTTAKCVSICAQHDLVYRGLNAKGQCACNKPITLPQGPPAVQQAAPPPAPLGPPPVLRDVDCVGLPMPATQYGSLPSDFMRRVQAAINYSQTSPLEAPVPITGQFDFLTQLGWSQFVNRYGTWDSTIQKFVGSDPNSITCDGLMLLKKTNDQIYSSQQNFVGPLDDGTQGRTAADPSSSIVFEERDKLWLVSPDSRPDLRQALQDLTHTITKTGSGGTIYARCQPSSGPIPLGKDALTAVRAKIAAGYAAMIATKSDFSSVFVAYTKSATVIATNCSTKGSLRQAQLGGSMNGFGIDYPNSPLLSGSSPGGGLDPSQIPSQPPDPTTGLPTWALYEGEPPPLIDAARALFTVTGATPSPAQPPAVMGGGTSAPPPGTYVPSPYPSYPAPAPPPVAAAAATTPSWVKPLAIVGGLGLVAYFAFAE